jgi:hypothetical protein
VSRDRGPAPVRVVLSDDRLLDVAACLEHVGIAPVWKPSAGRKKPRPILANANRWWAIVGKEPFLQETKVDHQGAKWLLSDVVAYLNEVKARSQRARSA